MNDKDWYGDWLIPEYFPATLNDFVLNLEIESMSEGRIGQKYFPMNRQTREDLFTQTLLDIYELPETYER